MLLDLDSRATLIPVLLRSLRPVLAPALVLSAAALAVALWPALPVSLAGLVLVGPYVLLALGAIIGAWFNRGRAFIALASLLVAYAAYDLAMGLPGTIFAARTVFTALAILVPANVLVALVLPERGVLHHHNYRWLLLAAAEILLVAWIAAAGRSAFSGTVWHEVLDNWLLRSPPTPLVGRVFLAAAFALAVARAWPERSPLDIGIAAALAAVFIACEWVTSPGFFGAFMSAAGVILLVSLLQESHRLAFRDELTAIPGRRALEERLSGLGERLGVTQHAPTATEAKNSSCCSKAEGWRKRCRGCSRCARQSRPTRWLCAVPTVRKIPRLEASCATRAGRKEHCR